MATPSFTTTFNLNLGQFSFFDTTDYAAQGVAPASNDLKGCLKIVTPDGLTYYNNTDFSGPGCDINISDPPSVNIPLSQQTITLPTIGGAVQQGTYLITYTVFNATLSATYTVTQSTSFEFTAPEVTIEQTVDCISPLFTSVDTTNYLVNGVTPSNTRTHSIIPPAGSGGSTVTGSGATITTSTFYTPATTTSTVSSILTYNVSSTLIIIVTVTGRQEAQVDCGALCDMLCCIQFAYNRMVAADGTNDAKRDLYKTQFNDASSVLTLFMNSIACNLAANVSDYQARIREITQCTEDCLCTDDDIRLVQGVGGGNTFVVDSCSSAIGVTPATVGDTTTYTICFNATLLSKLNASYNTVVAAGTGITVTGPVTVGDTKTYTVANAAVPATPTNYQEFKCEITYSNFSVPAVSISSTDYIKTGANLGTNSGIVASVGFGSDPNWATKNNQFTLSGFQVSANDNYKVHLELIKGAVTTKKGQVSSQSANYLAAKSYDIEVFDITNGQCRFCIKGQDGSTRSNQSLVATGFIVNVKISE